PGTGNAGTIGIPGSGSGTAGGGLDRTAFDNMFKGTPLQGKYDTVVAEAQKNGVPPSLMAGIIAHETGKGTSKMLAERNNPAGLMDPKTGMSTGQTFASVDEGIAAAGRSIGKNYARGGGTIEGMSKSYAPIGAGNDPGGLNKNWVGGVGASQRALAAPSPSVTPGTPSAAIDLAMTQLGLHEQGDRQAVMQYLRQGGAGMDPARAAWCAAFVNSTLTQVGIKGTNSPAAGSFTNWGVGVTPDQAATGDVGVVRGRSPRTGLEGSHVGLLTGERRMNQRGQLELEMLGGNQGSDNVNKKWYMADRLHLRRPTELLDRSPIDRQNAGGAIASKGQLDVNVKAPPGTGVDYNGNNLLKPGRMERQTQMPETSRSTVYDDAMMDL
ncbi:MAG TPA: glucosaminidase domain-containing protein, partial [Xanthobacteraceae bacterium]|nr:glucosaminidase domain-containing protein [Xanthobacteraceae bacterium]